jgi:hypothetical protein
MTTSLHRPPGATADLPDTGERPDGEAGTGLAFLSKTVKARGYACVGLAALAAGTLNGQHARLIISSRSVSQPGRGQRYRAADRVSRACIGRGALRGEEPS